MSADFFFLICFISCDTNPGVLFYTVNFFPFNIVYFVLMLNIVFILAFTIHIDVRNLNANETTKTKSWCQPFVPRVGNLSRFIMEIADIENGKISAAVDN